MAKLVAFGFSQAATQSWKNWDINFPGTSDELMSVFRKYQEMLRKPVREEPSVNLPELDQESLDQLGATEIAGALGLALTSRPVSEVVSTRLEAALAGRSSTAVPDYDEIVEWMAQTIEDSIMQFVGADGWQLLIEGDPLRHEVFELLLVELVQTATGTRVANTRAILDLWLAGRPVLGILDEENCLLVW